ncbi:MAG: ATP-binding protein [Desulfobulbaceae bacterium]|nr:ATP-binding protein [Desulfobulbaceae bacterium]
MPDLYDENRPLYGSRGIDLYLKLIKKKYNYINIDELLAYAEMEPYQVEDEGHFFSQRQINRFYEKLVELTSNQKIAREAGRFSSSPEAYNIFGRFTIGLMSPVKFYNLMGYYVNKISKSSYYEAKVLSSNKVEITVTPNPGTREESFQCENRMGYWEAMSTYFKLKPSEISHPECIFKGDKVCRYLVSWPKSPVTVLKNLRNLTVALFGLLVIFFLPVNYFYHNYLSLMTIVSLSLITVTIILITNWFLKNIETKNLLDTIDLLRNSSDELIEQIDINYVNSLLINEIGQTLAKQYEIEDLFNEIIRILHKRLDYDRILIMLANQDKTSLNFQAGYGYEESQKEILENLSFHLDNQDSKGIFYLSFQNKKPILLNNIKDLKNDLSERSYEFALRMGVKSLICCPILYENEPLGILAVDNIVSKRPLLQRDMNLLMGVASQIGSRLHNINLESHLRQIQKMEAVGNLAGGVAHDFNNILTTILGYSQILSLQIPQDDPIWKMVDSIHHAGIKASALTQQLLAFSRKQVLEMKVTNLNLIVEDMNKMLSRLIDENIIIKTYLSNAVGNISADPSQIGQILMNLVVNARDAMPNGGRLTIETGDIFLDEKYANTRSDVTPGLYSMLSVTDTGIGMAPEVREKIFEPFFTTKEVGKGTGLGLATVYGIVKQHHGHIHVYSEEGHGTSFKIYFPITGGELSEQEMNDNLVMARGTETILVVDDDESIRSLILETLKPLGYTLLEASDGIEALKIYGDVKGKIDMVLSDVIMPGMDGKELLDKLKEKQPDLKAILMSGYTDNVIAHLGDLDSYVLVNKPLLPVSLANRIRQILDNPVTRTRRVTVSEDN